VLPGGRHPAWGTHNAIVPLGPTMYLEIIAPDPSAPPPAGPRPLGLDTLAAPRLATWVAAGTDLEHLARSARARGIDLGDAMERGRERPDGVTLRWTMTDPMADRAGGVIPFYIDWGTTPHPGSAGPAECRLLSLVARHPTPDTVRAQLDFLGLPLIVELANTPGLTAVLETTRGNVTLD
jgi:hypothetical protein